MDRLAEIVETKRSEVVGIRPDRDRLRDAAEAAPPARRFQEALRQPNEVRLLAEVKRRSPSAGAIREGAVPADIATAYEQGGAAALSVLTDGAYFGGDLDALRSARRAVSLPILRKDFMLEEVQIWESRANEADAILLIVRILSDDELRDLHALATELGMAALVEVHDRGELERALGIGASLIGVNNRDLRTFKTDLALSFELAASVSSDVTLVAESGIRTPDDVQRLGAAGVDAILVGESLMRQPDVEAAAAALSGHPRNPLVRP